MLCPDQYILLMCNMLLAASPHKALQRCTITRSRTQHTGAGDGVRQGGEAAATQRVPSAVCVGGGVVYDPPQDSADAANSG